MGLFNIFKRSDNDKSPIVPTVQGTTPLVEPAETEPTAKKKSAPRKPRETKPKETAAEKTAKQLATERGEPYVNIDRVIIDPVHPGQGGFELDWNEFFVARLVKAGYAGKTDEDIVDQWFSDVCRNVALEIYEQIEANGPRVNKRDVGDGRVEIG
jgi:hypothetical protein